MVRPGPPGCSHRGFCTYSETVLGKLLTLLGSEFLCEIGGSPSLPRRADCMRQHRTQRALPWLPLAPALQHGAHASHTSLPQSLAPPSAGGLCGSPEWAPLSGCRRPRPEPYIECCDWVCLVTLVFDYQSCFRLISPGFNLGVLKEFCYIYFDEFSLTYPPIITAKKTLQI